MNHTEERNENNPVELTRRSFLALIPLGVFGAIIGSLGVASKRFLAPTTVFAQIGETPVENWKSVGAISDFAGEEPIARTVSVAKQTGWSKTIEDVTVYVLPHHENKVLSSVCPHEGCPIVWETEKKNFLCPCHDSFFSDKGKCLWGPAKSDLTEIETKMENGNLQIKI